MKTLCGPDEIGMNCAADALERRRLRRPMNAPIRRFARLDEVIATWSPTDAGTVVEEGLFGYLRARVDAGVSSRSVARMSWSKFERTVLHEATALELQVPERGDFVGLLTAAVTDAPRLLQWHHPVSCYVYSGGSTASRWNLRAGAFVRVTATCELPRSWGDDATRLSPGRQRILVLEGAYETMLESLGLFPETIRSELHGVRSVLEAYSRSGSIRGDRATATANGILVANHRPITLRAELPGATLLYEIDRIE